MDAVTICAANYLPFAEILGKSFLEHNPDSSFYLLLVDGEKTSTTVNEAFKVIYPSQIGLDPNLFERMAVYYDVTELSTALKPFVLKHLMNESAEIICYLDPDIKVFSDLSFLEFEFGSANIALTPHTLNPVPRDGQRPSETEIMASGTFNLGFIALRKSEEANNFLNWWKERLIFDAISDPKAMLFTDQRWIDLVPSYFNFKVLRNPGLNVAYWNLHERNISKKGDGYLINGEPLFFFHFSGYAPNKPWILGKYVSSNPRAKISDSEILYELTWDYGIEAINNGWDPENKTIYGFSHLKDGTFLTLTLRRIYRDHCIEFANNKVSELIEPEQFSNWLKSSSTESKMLNRFMFKLWELRPDLQKTFPEANSRDAKAFKNWAYKHGVSENAVTVDFIETIEVKNQDHFVKDLGINVAGYLMGEFGVGQSLRLLAKAAQATKLPVRLLNSTRTTSRQTENIHLENKSEIYPVTVAVVNADQFELWVSDTGSNTSENTKVIGVWAWEIEDFPSRMFKAFDLVDEIWAVSNFVKRAIEKHTYKPVFVVPTPVEAPEVTEKLDRAAISIPDSSLYNLFIFDYLSVFNRKNPLAVIEAHKIAFPNEDGPLLVIKSMNGDKFSEQSERLKYEIRNRKDIYLVEDYLSRPQMTALMNECFSYISLHRSEGYGLTVSEAMSLGKPVIVTGYSGNMDFCNNDVAMVVPYELVTVGSDSFPYSPESKWAEPDSRVASQYLKHLYENQDFALALGARAKEFVTNEFTIEKCAQFIYSRVFYQMSLRAEVSAKYKSLLTLSKKILRKLKSKWLNK